MSEFPLSRRGDGRPNDPFADPLDAVLAEVAVNIQLPPGLHAKAVDRYEAVRRYIERPGSPLEGRVACFYSQGSMAIDATISTRGTDDEYDLDIVAEIDGPDEGPEALLDALEAALAGYPVSRIVRQTRCITLYYADGMHLDVTPSRRRAPKEKQGEIPHAKSGAGSDLPRYVPMNSYAFTQWYSFRAPVEERFALALNRRLYEEAGIAFAAADVEEVPPQTPLIIKSVTTVALQLVKRHRNIVYATEAGRIPPSVMLSCHAGHAARLGLGLAEMVIRQARWTARAIDDAAKQGRLLSVVNPEFAAERFTDRWPETQVQQMSYSRLLHTLANGLEAARNGDVQLEDLQIWLREQFGDHVVTRSITAFNQRLGRQVQARQHGYTRSGGLFTPAAPAIIGTATGLAPVAARAHTNMGERR
jgi:hypothetical protein